MVARRRPGLAEKRFCRACAPRGAVAELSCAFCTDAPLLAGELTEARGFILVLSEMIQSRHRTHIGKFHSLKQRSLQVSGNFPYLCSGGNCLR